MRVARWLLWVVAVPAAAVTVVHGLKPGGPIVHGAASTSAVLETAVSCAALLLAALFFGRWRQRQLLFELLTCFSLSVLAAGKVAFTVVPLTHTGSASQHVRVAALLCGAVAAVALAAASFAPDRPSRWSPKAQVIALAGGVAATIALLWVASIAFSGAFDGLPELPSTDALGDNSASTLTVVQVLSAAGFTVAAAGFARRQRLTGDLFYRWFAIAGWLWALARVNYALTPTSLVNDLTVGDWLRLAGYAVGVVAASYEFTNYWRRMTTIAVLEERRRLARDMHDGVAQELAFLVTQSRRLGTRVSAEEIDVLVRAAERALDESRRGIAALTRALDEPLDVALAQHAEELSTRLGVRVQLELEPVGHVSAETREGLLRIAREAISNAGRHANGSIITVRLANHDGVTLTVSDDGQGFTVDDPQISASGRFGLVSMRDRSEALGGRLHLSSKPNVGTTVQVWVP